MTKCFWWRNFFNIFVMYSDWKKAGHFILTIVYTRFHKFFVPTLVEKGWLDLEKKIFILILFMYFCYLFIISQCKKASLLLNSLSRVWWKWTSCSGEEDEHVRSFNDDDDNDDDWHRTNFNQKWQFWAFGSGEPKRPSVYLVTFATKIQNHPFIIMNLIYYQFEIIFNILLLSRRVQLK